MSRILAPAVLLISFLCSANCLASDTIKPELDIKTLLEQGNEARLRGDMQLANRIHEQVRRAAPMDPASYAFNLNTLVTELSWEESQTRFDAELQSDAAKLLELCEAGVKSKAGIDNPDFYCGTAHFALSFYNGIRGNYIRAGRHGTTGIDYLEDALKQDPELIRAKMYLGIAYYYADNLPAYIKLFSRVLWFIPSGNSEKSLPYLKQVMASDDDFQDVARYLYSTLLINGTDAEVDDALAELGTLLKKHPENARFHLRYISVILGDGQYQETLDRVAAFFASEYAGSIDTINTNLLNIWVARAYIGLRSFDDAIAVQQMIQFDPENTTVPAWGLAWYELSSGQLADIKQNRSGAVVRYENVLELDKRTFVNPKIVEIANRYLDTPFSGAN